MFDMVVAVAHSQHKRPNTLSHQIVNNIVYKVPHSLCFPLKTLCLYIVHLGSVTTCHLLYIWPILTGKKGQLCALTALVYLLVK